MVLHPNAPPTRLGSDTLAGNPPPSSVLRAKSQTPLLLLPTFLERLQTQRASAAGLAFPRVQSALAGKARERRADLPALQAPRATGLVHGGGGGGEGVQSGPRLREASALPRAPGWRGCPGEIASRWAVPRRLPPPPLSRGAPHPEPAQQPPPSGSCGGSSPARPSSGQSIAIKGPAEAAAAAAGGDSGQGPAFFPSLSPEGGEPGGGQANGGEEGAAAWHAHHPLLGGR